MFKIIACNKANCHLTVLQPHTKIQNLSSNKNRKPTKPLRLHLREPLYIDMANNIPKTPQPINMTIQQHFNHSCFPIDSELSSGTKLDRHYSSIPAIHVGDYQKSSDLDRRPTLQGVGETCVTVEGPSTCEARSEQSHPDSIQDIGNSV